jgi:hypothetical protein
METTCSTCVACFVYCCVAYDASCQSDADTRALSIAGPIFPVILRTKPAAFTKPVEAQQPWVGTLILVLINQRVIHIVSDGILIDFPGLLGACRNICPGSLKARGAHLFPTDNLSGHLACDAAILNRER